MEIAEFLLARIDEDEEWARRTEHPAFDGFLRFDPARVLAESDAKRRIVALHTEVEPGAHECPGRYSTASIAEGAPCETVLLLALPYADHPDFREEWRPAAHV